MVPFSWTGFREAGHDEVYEGAAAAYGGVVCPIWVLRGGCDPGAGYPSRDALRM